MRYPLITILVFLLAWPNTSPAEVIESDWQLPGDGLLTLDLDSGLEWLDLTQSQLSDYSGSVQQTVDALIVDMEPGGRLEGFEFATIAELQSFASSSGIDIGTRSYEANGVAASNLIALLGNPQGSATNNGSATGRIVSNGQFSTRMSIASFPGGRSASLAGLLYTASLDYATINHGVWLRRTVPVPEPGSIFMSIFACIACFIVRPRYALP